MRCANFWVISEHVLSKVRIWDETKTPNETPFCQMLQVWYKLIKMIMIYRYILVTVRIHIHKQRKNQFHTTFKSKKRPHWLHTITEYCCTMCSLPLYGMNAALCDTAALPAHASPLICAWATKRGSPLSWPPIRAFGGIAPPKTVCQWYGYTRNRTHAMEDSSILVHC